MDAGETATLTVANVTGLVPGLALAGTMLVVDPSHAAFQGLAAGEDGSALIDVLANDSVGDTLTIVSVGAARHGTAAIEDGQVRYTPAADYVGADSTSTVTVTVTGANNAPVGRRHTGRAASSHARHQLEHVLAITRCAHLLSRISPRRLLLRAGRANQMRGLTEGEHADDRDGSWHVCFG